MTDLDDLVATRLREQPAVVVPSMSAIERRVARRRQRTAASWALAVVVAGTLAAAPVLMSDRGPDVVDSSPPEPLVRSDAVVLGVCYAGRRGCAYSPHEARIAELVALVNTDRPTTARTGCTAADSDAPDVRIQFAYPDGTHDDVRVVDCLLTRGRQGRGPASYAPEVARLASSGLTSSAEGSTREGCAAVVEDLAALLARPVEARRVQVAERTMAEERTYLTGPQRAVVDEIEPYLNWLLLGHSPEGASSDAVLREGLSDLRALCDTA